MKPRARIVLAIVACIVAFALPARADERTRIVIRTIVALDEALCERTVGQLSDLPATVECAPSETLEPSLGARLEEALALARQRDATLIVWFEHPPDSPTTATLFIAMPSRGRVLVRKIASDSPSAMLEASSLVVRSALLALEAGASLGVPTGELIREETPRATTPAPAAPQAPPSQPSMPVERQPRLPSWHPFVGLGWQVSIDGRSPAGARAGVLEAGLSKDEFFVLARGSLGLPSRSHDELASLEVARHCAEAFFGARLASGGGIALEALAGIGAVVYHRAAFRRDPTFTPSPPSTHPSAVGSLELRFAWTPARGAPFRLGLSAGADAIASPPSFSYVTSQGAVDLAARFVEPRLGFLASYVW